MLGFEALPGPSPGAVRLPPIALPGAQPLGEGEKPKKRRRTVAELTQAPQNLKCPFAQLGCNLGASHRFLNADAWRRHVERRKTDCRTSKYTGRGKHITLPSRRVLWCAG